MGQENGKLHPRAVYLTGLGHDAIICKHGSGHTVPMGKFPPTLVLAFFKAHPLGVADSPYAAGLPSDLTSMCEFRAKQ